METYTPLGRAMRNICIAFAQLERETIQKRVTDGLLLPQSTGLSDGRESPLRLPYGADQDARYINTKKLVINPDETAEYPLDI